MGTMRPTMRSSHVCLTGSSPRCPVRCRKPHVDHFLACLDRLCVTDPSRVAHVGDSLHHDVAGANAAAIPSIFVTSGIHASEFDWTFGQLPPDLELEHLFAREGLRPTHVVASFQF